MLHQNKKEHPGPYHQGYNTKIEQMLSKALFHRGIRFRKNSKKIYGHPDISIEKYKIAIFCDGDFWHGWDWENRRDSIKTNREYWIPKIERNMEKDIEVNHVLSYLGYTVLRVWEHEIRNDLEGVCDMIESKINEIKANKKPHTDKRR